MMREKLQKAQIKRLVILNLPYFFIFYVADKGSWLYRHCLGESMVQRLGVMLVNFRPVSYTHLDVYKRQSLPILQRLMQMDPVTGHPEPMRQERTWQWNFITIV